MQPLHVNISTLKSIKNYAVKESVTSSYIYKLIKEKKLDAVDIDGVKFIDTSRYPAIKRSV